MAPFPFFRALLSRFTDQPVVLRTRVYRQAFHRGGAIDQGHGAEFDLSGRAAVDELALGSFARPLAADVARENLSESIALVSMRKMSQHVERDVSLRQWTFRLADIDARGGQ